MNEENYAIKKHAYLIIAHNEFLVLQKAIDAVDDWKNDIYVHIDRKILLMPNLVSKKSHLFILPERLNVKWGHISQIETELLLFETAFNKGAYAYYHLISGTHFPLKSQEYIHGLCAELNKSIFQYMETCEAEIDAKIRRYNLFNGYMMSNISSYSYVLGHLLWILCLKPQKILRIKRFRQSKFYKSSNWVSLRSDAVAYLLSKKKYILKKYKYTFCGDEFFALSELMNSPLKDELYIGGRDNLKSVVLLYCCFDSHNPKVLELADFKKIIESRCLFARKFSESKSLPLLELLIENIKKQN
ncbi:MAG: glycosyl transferase [Bacteroides sp.]|nr:hypothetical protein [Roseburia sp.]MCM1346015.1 glycosyl transferase [Bacteroides sp.]MCM1421481.1 glycosyl transferase [Bacteroides sp.]